MEELSCDDLDVGMDAHRSHGHVKVEVSFETARYTSAQNTLHVSPMEAPPQLEFKPTLLCIKVSEPSICEHDG